MFSVRGGGESRAHSRYHTRAYLLICHPRRSIARIQLQQSPLLSQIQPTLSEPHCHCGIHLVTRNILPKLPKYSCNIIRSLAHTSQSLCCVVVYSYSAVISNTSCVSRADNLRFILPIRAKDKCSGQQPAAVSVWWQSDSLWFPNISPDAAPR